MAHSLAHAISQHTLAFAYAAFIGLTVYFLSGAGFGWFVLEQQAAYGASGPIPGWEQPAMLFPAMLIALLCWSRAEAHAPAD